MNTSDVIDLMGGSITDKELGLPDGTLEKAASVLLGKYSDYEINVMCGDTFNEETYAAIDFVLS